MNHRMLLTRAVFCGLATIGYAYGGVLNGGFEDGTFANWTHTGDLGYSAVSGTFGVSGCPVTDHCVPHGGTYAAFMGSQSFGQISQSLTTQIGFTYIVDFFLSVDVDGRAPGNGPLNNEYRVSWNSVVQLQDLNAPRLGWQHFSFSATATSTSTDLMFAFRNGPDAFGLDDVSISAGVAPAAGSAVPEPVSLILAGTSLIALAGLSRMLRRRRR